MATRLAAAFLLGVLAGCAVLQPGAEQSVAADSIVGEALSAARAPVAEQKAALSRAQQRFLQEPTMLNRVRLATLLAALPAPLRDDARAVELLESVADASVPGLRRFAPPLFAPAAGPPRPVPENHPPAPPPDPPQNDH